MSSKNVLGTLIPIGGNEDKGIENSTHHPLEFEEDGILSHVVKEAGGERAKVVVIPTASSIPVEVADHYLEAFDRLGVQNVSIADIRERSQSDEREMLALIEQADCVMFSGGDQSKITKKIGGTKLHALLAERYINESFVIAGTSAGAMAMSEEMITGGSAQESMLKGAIGMNKGLALMPTLIIDTHFIRRGRFGRLAEAVARFPKLIGIGLAEDTGLIIKNQNKFKVIGSGMVIVFDPSGLTHNNHAILPDSTPMSMCNLSVHILASDDEFTVDNRTIQVSPFNFSTLISTYK